MIKGAGVPVGVVAFLTASLGGCTHELDAGRPCSTTQDCPVGQVCGKDSRCSPGSADDLSAADKAAQDQRPPDAPRPDLRVDAPLQDMPTPDASRPDLKVDAAALDQPAPDKPQPDLPQPDLPQPDLPQPDLQQPDLPPPDSGPCKKTSDCNDNLSCTVDTCGDGGCLFTPAPNYCVIAGKCTVAQTANPQNACQVCDPTKSSTSWTGLNSGSCDDGIGCTHTDVCAAGICSGKLYSCNDSLTCTTDVCTGSGPGAGGCTNTVQQGSCVIDKKCYKAGAAYPNISCKVCDPKVSTTKWTLQSGCVVTFAGTGASGSLDGPALSATFLTPRAIDVTPAGVVYVATWAQKGKTVRKIEGGIVSTGYDNMGYPTGIAVSSAGRITANDGPYRIFQFSFSGLPAITCLVCSKAGLFADGPVNQAMFNHIGGLALDATNTLYIGDGGNNRVRVIANGVASTIGGGATAGYKDGPAATSLFKNPTGVFVDIKGTVYVTDTDNHRIRTITAGVVATLAGNGNAVLLDGPAKAASFNYPSDLVVDAKGNVYVADHFNNSIRLISNGQVTTVAGGAVPGFKDGPGKTAKFDAPASLDLDSAGNIYVADTKNSRIRLIKP